MSMSESNALTPLTDADYGSIECAVMETERGRWFLSEYARRNRNTDTEAVLEAIGKLESAVTGEGSKQGLDRIFLELMEMAKTISKTKSEISAIIPSDNALNQSALEEATSVLDGIVQSTETATQAILGSSERIQETAWTLREQGANSELCDALNRHATDIYTSCSFQDITSQRIVKVVHVMRYLEGRIHAMIDIWDHPNEVMDSASPENGATSSSREKQTSHSAHYSSVQAPLPGGLSFANALSQLDIDDVIIDPEGMYNSEPVDLDKLKYVIETPSLEVMSTLSSVSVINEDVYSTQGEAVEVEDLVHLQSFDEREKEQENTDIVLSGNNAFFLEEVTPSSVSVPSVNSPIVSEESYFHEIIPEAAPEAVAPETMVQTNTEIAFSEYDATDNAFDLDGDEGFAIHTSEPTQSEVIAQTPQSEGAFGEDALSDVSFDEDETFNVEDVIATQSLEIQHHSLSSMPAPALPHLETISLDDIEPFDIEGVDTSADSASQAEIEAFANDDVLVTPVDLNANHVNLESDLDFSFSSEEAFDIDVQETDVQETQIEETLETQAVEPSELVDPRKAAFAAIDQMDTAQKLSRFS
jgi:chemotaxis regulatin CheY-phosphate phosphatase CheZ